MKKTSLLLLLLAGCLLPCAAQERADSVAEKTSFGQKLLKPLKWIGKNWGAYDPHYSLPSFYDWALQLQNTTTQEWLNMQSPEGMDLKMNSRMSNRLGPYFGYQWLFYGATIDLNTIGKPASKGKNEFTLSINSNLVNIDVIRRRTGGDFRINRLDFNFLETGYINLVDKADQFDFGDYIKNSLTGVNINVFTNHRKYSNPAAFSNGAVQLRSVGSPIVGIGYTHQKVENDVSDMFAATAAALMATASPELGDYIYNKLDEVDHLYDTDRQAYFDEMGQLLDAGWSHLHDDPEMRTLTRAFLTNHIPTVTRIDDWHLQLGYAYNLVFSRRLLLGLSAVVSPGIKRMQANNSGSIAYGMADNLSMLIKKHENVDVPADYFRYYYDEKQFNVNTFLRASLTFNYNRWRAGINASFSNYYYNKDGMKVRNGYGNLTTYVGYCFGRKKEYRYDGALRQDYINAALTKRQIEEMRDTLPEGNLAAHHATLTPHPSPLTPQPTAKYHSDRFKIAINGCDLVAGPDGSYGWYELQDGYVTPGQDSEGRLSVGKRIEIRPADDDGTSNTATFICEAGHDGNFRTGNWWKSQLRIDQIPNHWYPEMLHYALCGRLTLYLRGRVFGTKKPVRVDIDGFCVNHGKDTETFTQMGVKSFRSNSTYSVEGTATVGGRDYRIFIEQKKRGGKTGLYVSRVYPHNAVWMKGLDGHRPISTISMPGTHDAGSAALPPSPIFNNAHTQNFSLADQLHDGIRAFDIRLKRSLRYGHTMTSRDSYDSTLVAWDRFLSEHPSEFIVALVGSDEGGRWDEELTENYSRLIARYPHRFTEHFSATTPVDSVRGKILVIRRQEECTFGKLLKFEDNATFSYDCFRVEDVYKQFKTWRKIKLVEQNIREAYENDDPGRWFITFNSIAWSPRRHNPYSYAWGDAKNIRKPMNKTLREVLELKDYTDFGIVFLDFYNDHGEQPQLVQTIIQSNFHRDDE